MFGWLLKKKELEPRWCQDCGSKIDIAERYKFNTKTGEKIITGPVYILCSCQRNKLRTY